MSCVCIVILLVTLGSPAASNAVGSRCVPFLPQTEALCGGAAAAMVFRYWGDRHADVQQFESLVDPRAGGIADTALVDAIRARGWNAERIDGSLATIRRADGRRPSADPADRRSSVALSLRGGRRQRRGAACSSTTLRGDRPGGCRQSELLRRWQPTGFWTLLVTAGTLMSGQPPPQNQLRAQSERQRTTCDRCSMQALDTIQADGPGVADEALGAVSQQCPTDSGPLRELAGIRFSQRRWHDAAALAEQALARERSRRVRVGCARLEPIHSRRYTWRAAGVESHRQAES